MSQSPELSVSQAVATITLRRPEQANRLTPSDVETIVQHVQEVNARKEVLVLQFRAVGKYFCSGYDISSINSSSSTEFSEMVDAIESARPITLSALHGSVYGGATDLALACDFRVGTQGIDMFMPAAKLGLHFYQSGMERYVTRLGLDNAKRLFLTAERIYASEMKAIGYLTHLVDKDQLDVTVQQLSSTCSEMAPLAVLGMKKHLNRIGRGTLDPAALRQDIDAAHRSKDLQEGQAAWSERRRPVFTGI